jgi:hypothetical protein
VLLGPILLALNSAATVYVPRVSMAPVDGTTTLREVQNFSDTLRVNPAELTERETHDGQSYSVWHKQTLEGGPAGKYLVDAEGVPQFLVDPGINGVHRRTPDGMREVAKFDAPKATLMSYIIKGILNRQLPWGLVLLGVMIALILEMSGVPSLAFAVGVYLPLSTSSPIFFGGLIRWLGDRYFGRKHRGRNFTSDSSLRRRTAAPACCSRPVTSRAGRSRGS